MENDQAPLSAPLVSELYDAKVGEFLPLFAFHAMITYFNFIRLKFEIFGSK